MKDFVNLTIFQGYNKEKAIRASFFKGAIGGDLKILDTWTRDPNKITNKYLRSTTKNYENIYQIMKFAFRDPKSFKIKD